jgi:hypothetical protein
MRTAGGSLRRPFVLFEITHDCASCSRENSTITGGSAVKSL